MTTLKPPTNGSNRRFTRDDEPRSNPVVHWLKCHQWVASWTTCVAAAYFAARALGVG